MLLPIGLLLVFTALSTSSPAQQPPSLQNVLDLSHASSQAGNPRKLRGKFLHITDIHPDPFYKQGTDPSGDHPCHAGHGSAGYFGTEKSECDSPFSLVNATFDWIKHNIKDEIDFVVWTGDSARHDNDERYPRTNKGVEQLNRFVVTKFDEVFGKPDNRHDPDPTNDFVVPIVPTFGNNDILPHNIFQSGPNKWTRKYLSIWEKFIPQEQRHSFARGGWFFTEVIPNRLAVFSLNTLYFFDSNAAVDGCDATSEPGYEHFEWLRIQLEFLRQRNMKAILIGHVPPARTDSKQNWDETCYQKYTLWLRQYRDVVVGNVFGHMNIDHFTLQDVRELTYKFKIKGIDDEGLRDQGSSLSAGFKAQAKSDYLSDLRQLWGNLPSPPHGSSYLDADIDVDVSSTKKKRKKERKKLDKYLREIGGPYGERFSLSVISPSVVPNFYPTLRIIEYNITGLKHDHPALRPTAPVGADRSDLELLDSLEEETIREDAENNLDTDNDGYEIDKKKKKRHKKKKGKKAKPNFPVPKPPSKSSPPGPGYSPQPLSFISWKQFYANLTKINEAVAKEVNYKQLGSGLPGDRDLHEQAAAKKHFTYELEYDTTNDTVRPLKDLTMRSWLDYAERIGRPKYAPLATELKFNSRIAEQYMDDVENHDTAVDHNAEAVISSSVPHDLLLEDDDSEDEDSVDESRVSLDCLIYLWKRKNGGLKRYNPNDSDPWSSRLLQRINDGLALTHCPPPDNNLDLQLDHDRENDDNDEQDSGYESDPDVDSEDDTPDSGYEYSEDEDDEYVGITKNKKRKCKGKHKKKCKKRKGESLKKNHLWHHFVRRAFVGTKSWEDLIDEFG